MKPVIGISLDYSTEETFARRPWYALRCDYSSAISLSGGIPIFIPHLYEHIEKYVDMIDGLLIPGCDSDIHPILYGEEVKYSSVKPELLRAEFEIKLMEAALKKNIPFLGICHGMQLMNIFYGGTLIQHIPSEVVTNIIHRQDHPKTALTHKIIIKDNTKLSTMVNSSHHQAIKNIGSGLVVSAIAPDGVIEAIEDPSYKFMIGCEWHPEYMSKNGVDIEIFQEFIKSAASS